MTTFSFLVPQKRYRHSHERRRLDWADRDSGDTPPCSNLQALSFSPSAPHLNHYRTNKYMTHHQIRSHLISPQERQLHSTSTCAHLRYNPSFPPSLPFSPAQFHCHPSRWRTQRRSTRCKSSANNTDNEAQSGLHSSCDPRTGAGAEEATSEITPAISVHQHQTANERDFSST